MSSLLIAPQHERNISEHGVAYVIESVAYDSMKVTHLCNYHPDSRVYCKNCEWETTVSELPHPDTDNSVVQPDMCPDCVKRGELGFVRSTPKAAKEQL